MEVTNKLIEQINEKLENHYVTISQVKKNNVEKKGITIIPKEGNRTVCPTIYVDDINTFSEVMEIVRAAADIEAPVLDIEKLTSREYITNNLRAAVISRDNVILEDEDVVYRSFLDMAIIYRIVVPAPSTGQIGTILLKKSMLEYSGIKEVELYEIAKANRDYQVKTLFEMLYDITGVDYEAKYKDDAPEVYVVTSLDRRLGASILFTDLFKEVGEKISEKVYVIPCSIHEILLVPCDERIDIDGLRELVKYVNATEVSLEDKLTDSVYCLDENGISIAA